MQYSCLLLNLKGGFKMVKKKLNKKPRVQENNLGAYNNCWCSPVCTCLIISPWENNSASNIQSQPSALHFTNFTFGGPVPWSSEATK